MKVGAVFPQIEMADDPIVIRDFAQSVEDMGFDYLLAYDHVLGANPNRPDGWTGPYTHEDSFHEPFVLFAYLAGLTQTIEFVTGIIILPQRQTVLVAKQAAQLDVLSGGRLRLGVGIGWNAVEYEGLGSNFHDRGKRSEEQVQLMRELWTNELVTFNGKYHTVTDAGIKPLPKQRPIPVWFGGGAKEMVLRRVATLSDGWIVNSYPIEQIEEIIPRLRGYLEEAGRNPNEFGLDVRVSLRRQPIEEWQAYVDRWRELGATHISLDTMKAGLTSVQEHLDILAKFKAMVS